MMTSPGKFTWTTYDTLLRLDFVSFAQRCFRELSPRTPFAMNRHIEIIAAKLMALRKGYIRRLIINLPWRYLKSLLASVAFPAWRRAEVQAFGICGGAPGPIWPPAQGEEAVDDDHPPSAIRRPPRRDPGTVVDPDCLLGRRQRFDSAVLSTGVVLSAISSRHRQASRRATPE